MSVIYYLWLRELRRFARSRSQIAGALGQPILYLVTMGFGLGPVFLRAGQGSYLQFIVPGLIAMTLLFNSVISGMNLLWDRQVGFLKETLVAPVPRAQILIGRILGGASVALFQGVLVAILCLAVGFRIKNLSSISLALLVMALIAFVFSILGIALGSILRDVRGFQGIINFLIMPIFFLSGALFPLEGLPSALATATHVDPLAYGVDALRSTLNGQSYFNARLDVAVLGLLAILLFVGTLYLFEKVEV